MEQSSSSPRHFVIVGVLIFISTVVLYWLLDAALPLPAKASLQAIDIDWLFDLHVMLIAFLFSLVVVFMVYALIVFRRREGDDSDGEHFEGNTRLEIAWTSAPMIFVIIFSVLGIMSLNKVTAAQDGEIPVKVVAWQWAFAFYYGDAEHPPMEEGGTPYTDLVLVKDQPYIMHMRSRDVMHAFWVPAFRVKQDIMPSTDLLAHADDEHGDEHGDDHSDDHSDEHADDAAHAEDTGYNPDKGERFSFPTFIRFTPIEMGKYKLRCAELCGGTHYNMRNDVYVVDQEQYDRYIAGEDIQCILEGTEHPGFDPAEYDASRCEAVASSS